MINVSHICFLISFSCLFSPVGCLLTEPQNEPFPVFHLTCQESSCHSKVRAINQISHLTCLTADLLNRKLIDSRTWKLSIMAHLSGPLKIFSNASATMKHFDQMPNQKLSNFKIYLAALLQVKTLRLTTDLLFLLILYWYTFSSLEAKTPNQRLRFRRRKNIKTWEETSTWFETRKDWTDRFTRPWPRGICWALMHTWILQSVNSVGYSFQFDKNFLCLFCKFFYF